MNSFYKKRSPVVALLIIASGLSFQSLAESLQIADTRYHLQILSLEGKGLAMAIGDFNNDSYSDMAVTSESDGKFVVFTGDRKGKFTKLESYNAGHEPSEIVTSDINGDGHLDLIIANHETKYMTLYHGQGSGTFIPARPSQLSIDVSPHPHIVRVKDINDDKNPDLIVDNRDATGLLLIKNVDNGHFDSRGKVIVTGGDPYLGFTVDDVNNDGMWDFITPNSDHIGIVLGKDNKDLVFEDPMRIDAQNPFAVELADLNADTFLDIIYASLDGPVSIIHGDGSGKFDTMNQQNIEFVPGAKRIATGDINGDGIRDILVSNWSADVMFIMGGKKNYDIQRFKPDDIANPWMIVIEDLNKDKKGDLIIADGDGKQLAIYSSVSK
tara:strand:+ start:2044 stop:3189 length:1146 start_codon:yes stop_codon:yes gene_type:complete